MNKTCYMIKNAGTHRDGKIGRTTIFLKITNILKQTKINRENPKYT